MTDAESKHQRRMLANFIPAFVAEKYRNDLFYGTIEGSVLISDISGFTELTQSLFSYGKTGAEELSEILNGFFAEMIERVYRNGGFVANFAGDAFTAVFPSDNGPRALKTAEEIGKRIPEHVSTESGTCRTGIKSGIAGGSITWSIYGSDPFTYLFSGEPVKRAAELQSSAEVGGIARSSEAELGEGSGRNAAGSSNWFSEVDLKVQERFVNPVYMEKAEAPEFRDVASVFTSYRDIEDLNRFADAVMGKARALGGYFNLMDCGDKGNVVLTIFGAPLTSERNVNRSLEFALGLREEFGEKVSSGISHGRVFAGFIGSPGIRGHYTVIGQQVNTAARLMEKCSPGQVLVEGSIASAVEGQYSFSSECGVTSRGAGPPKWFSAGRLTEVSSSLSFESDFVGREGEIGRTEEFLRESFSENRTSGLLISGEAGIGKTRFACHLQSLLPETKLIYLKCDEILSKSLNPIESFFEEVFGISGAVSSNTSERVFDRKFRSVVSCHADTEESEYHGKTLRKLKYVIKGFMGINEKGEYSRLDPRARFDNTILAFVHLIRLMASGSRLFVVLDDYQWIDSDSRSVMGDVFRQLDYLHPVLCVLARPQRHREKVNIFPEGVSLMRLDIKALEKEEQMELAENILPCEPGDSLRKRIQGLAEGNPLYIEQILLYMQERNMIQLSGGRAELSSSGVQLPGTVLDTIISRVDRLAPDVRKTVKVASVLGRRFNSRILSEMLHGNRVDLHLDTGVSERIWNRHSKLQYAFRHALIRDAVYGMQMEKQLEELHLKAGNVIESMYSEDARMFSDLSHHFLKCGDKTRMLKDTLKAAEYAKDNYRNREAMEMYSRYLHHRTDPLDRMEATLKLGEVWELVAQWDRAMELYEEVLSFSEGSEHWELRVQALMRIGFLKHRMGDNREALDCFQKAEAAYIEKDDTMGLATVYNNMGSAYLDLNDLGRAREYFNRTLEITGSNPNSEKADEVTMFAYNNLGLVNQSMNRLDPALECYQKSMEVAEKLNSRRNLAPLNFGNIRFLQRKINEAEKYYGIAMKNAEDIGDRHLVRVLLNNLAAISTVRGNYGKALEIYKKALLQALEMKDRKGIRLINQNIGEILAYMGRYSRAEEALDRAIETAEELQDQKALGAALGKRGIMLFFKGSMQESAESLKRAVPCSLNAGDWRNAGEFACFLAGAYHSLGSRKELCELAEKLEGIPAQHRKHCVPWHLPAVRLYAADLNGNLHKVMEIADAITEKYPGTEGEAVARRVRMKYLDDSEKAEERARIRSVYRQLNEENPVDYYRRMQELFTEN